MKKRTRRKKGLDAHVAAVTTPVFLLDGNRKIVFFNSGLEQLTGWTAEEVLGHVCDYATEADPQAVESLTGSLGPPPEVLAGKPVGVPAYLVHRDGKAVPRLLNFFPLCDADERVQCILGVVTAIDQPASAVEPTPAQQLHAELASLRILLRRQFGIKSFVCKSEAMTRVLEQIKLARSSAVPVLIGGEAGTGKEHVARLIHYESSAGSQSFVPIDCKRLSALELKQTLTRLLQEDESETSVATSLRPGTLYLSNVESLPRDVQERVATAFRSNPGDFRNPRDFSFRRGDPGEQRSLRLMAATTADLPEAVQNDAFRTDLFYLLTPLEISLPPLRLRREDVVPLAQHFLEALNRGEQRQVGGFADAVWQQFAEYNWPGNIDELAAVVSEARAACTEPLIRVEDLPFRFRTGLGAQSVGPAIQAKPMPLDPLLTQVETEQIQLALQRCRYNKSKAAKLLGITRQRLHRRMQTLGIEDLEPAK